MYKQEKDTWIKPSGCGYLRHHIRDKIHCGPQQINAEGIDCIYYDEWKDI